MILHNHRLQDLFINESSNLTTHDQSWIFVIGRDTIGRAIEIIWRGHGARVGVSIRLIVRLIVRLFARLIIRAFLGGHFLWFQPIFFPLSIHRAFSASSSRERSPRQWEIKQFCDYLFLFLSFFLFFSPPTASSRWIIQRKLC